MNAFGFFVQDPFSLFPFSPFLLFFLKVFFFFLLRVSRAFHSNSGSVWPIFLSALLSPSPLPLPFFFFSPPLYLFPHRGIRSYSDRNETLPLSFFLFSPPAFYGFFFFAGPPRAERCSFFLLFPLFSVFFLPRGGGFRWIAQPGRESLPAAHFPFFFPPFFIFFFLFLASFVCIYSRTKNAPGGVFVAFFFFFPPFFPSPPPFLRFFSSPDPIEYLGKTVARSFPSLPLFSFFIPLFPLSGVPLPQVRRGLHFPLFSFFPPPPFPP